jgi:hypothetical protein
MEQPENPAENIENTDQEEQAVKPSLKRHINKRNSLIAAGLIIILMLGELLFWRNRRMGFTKQFTVEGWHAVAVQSDEIAGVTKGDPSLDKTTPLATSLRKIDSTIKDQKVSLSLIPLLLNDRHAIDTYGAFLNKMGAYSSQVAGMSDDITAITDEDVDQAKTLSKVAAQQTTETKDQLKYLSEDINPSFYTVGEYLESLKKLSDEAKAKVTADAKNKKAQTEQDALDKQLVESTITGFMDGYISGDATKMKRYMTPAFITEYNFNQLSAENRKYTYPASYRVVSNTKSGDAGYTVQVNVLNKYKNTETNATDQYTTTYTYTVVYVASSGRWLINTEKSS